jgi:hypothetical protein
MYFNKPEAICLVRCLGHSQLISSLSPLVNKLFGGILSWAQTLIRSFTERQLSHKVHSYLIHNLCLTHAKGTKNTKKSSCPSCSQFVPSSFITCSQMTKHTASGFICCRVKLCRKGIKLTKRLNLIPISLHGLLDEGTNKLFRLS